MHGLFGQGFDNDFRADPRRISHRDPKDRRRYTFAGNKLRGMAIQVDGIPEIRRRRPLPLKSHQTPSRPPHRSCTKLNVMATTANTIVVIAKKSNNQIRSPAGQPTGNVPERPSRRSRFRPPVDLLLLYSQRKTVGHLREFGCKGGDRGTRATGATH